MTWMTPLEAITSVLMTFASLMRTPASVAEMVTACPSTVSAELELDHVGGKELTSDDVVLQDRSKLVFVLRKQEAVERAGRKLREGVVGGRQDREGARALQGLDETGGLKRSNEVLN